MITKAGMKHTEKLYVTSCFVTHVSLIYLETNRSEQNDFYFLTFDKIQNDAGILSLFLFHVGQRNLKSAHLDL